MNTRALDNLMETISPTGIDGFEGLVSYLLEKATGQSFRLSGSGQQSGQDSRAESGVGNSIKIEAKRYGETNLNRRGLVAEIAQATQIDDVDLWILVALCPVRDQVAKELEEQARLAGTEVIFIDKGIGGLQRVGCELLFKLQSEADTDRGSMVSNGSRQVEQAFEHGRRAPTRE